MNEYFAVAPDAATTQTELGLLLQFFGTQSGRYLMTLPHDWERLLLQAYEAAGDVARARMRRLLQKAHERCAFVPPVSLSWRPPRPWLENVIGLLNATSSPLAGAVVGSAHERPLPDRVIPIDELDLDVTAEEEIDATPQEIERVCRRVIEVGRELHLVDAHFNPCLTEYQLAMRPLVERMVRSKVRRLTVWTRRTNVARNSVAEIRDALRKLPARGMPLILHLVRDEGEARIHDRYLFSIRGGVELSYGAQAKSRLQTKASPMSAQILEAYVRRFHERTGHPLIEETIEAR